MIRYILPFLIVILCIPKQLCAQIATYQTKLRDSTLAILYAGIENSILIDNVPDNAKVKFDDVAINPLQRDFNRAHPQEKLFFVQVDKPGIHKLQIFDDRNKEIYSIVYTAKQPNDLKVQLGYVTGSEATVGEILSRSSVICYVPDCYLKPTYRLGCYEIILYRNNNKKMKEICAKNGEDLNDTPFDQHTQNAIRKLKRGDRLVIDRIRIIGQNSTTRLMPPIKVTIK